MKAVLFICLLAFMACDIVNILKCVYETPIVQEIISLAIKCIMTQDFTPLVDKIKESIPDLIQAVIGCVAKKNAIEDVPKVGIWKNKMCEYMCYNGPFAILPDKLRACLDRCNRGF